MDSGGQMSREWDGAVQDVVAYVPKLLDAYAELWELSQALLASVEEWKRQGSGGQLLVADEGEVRQFGG